MIQFTYSFCMALLHSFWQAALLMLLYITIDKIIHRNNAPLAKRNFLYAAIAVQLSLFVLTFFIYFFDAKGSGNVASLVQNVTAYVGGNNLRLITPWIFTLYIFVIAYKLVKAIYTWYHFKQLYKTGLQKPPIDLKLFTAARAFQFGIHRKVTLWLSNSIHTPVTFGYFKPIILLPVSLCNHISMQQAETLVLHELAHIRTNDYLLNWFLLSAETIFFFNPFVLSICKHIRLEREKNCDMQVISFAYSPALYAETLLQAARMKQLVPRFQLAAVSKKKHLLQRIQFFSSERTMNHAFRFNVVPPLLGLALLVMLSAAILFQSGKLTLPLSTSADVQYLPFNNHIITENEPVSFHVQDIKARKNTVQAQEQLRPVITSSPLIEPGTAVEPDADETEFITEPSYALPMSATENDASREIIIREEGSGATSLKVYHLSFDNGKWILQPEWVITAKEILIDSSSFRIDSTGLRNFKKVYPAQQ